MAICLSFLRGENQKILLHQKLMKTFFCQLWYDIFSWWLWALYTVSVHQQTLSEQSVSRCYWALKEILAEALTSAGNHLVEEVTHPWINMTDENREVKNHDYKKQWLTFIDCLCYVTCCSKSFTWTTTYYYYNSHFRMIWEIYLPRSHQVTRIGFESVP